MEFLVNYQFFETNQYLVSTYFRRQWIVLNSRFWMWIQWLFRKPASRDAMECGCGWVLLVVKLYTFSKVGAMPLNDQNSNTPKPITL
jgi:hypothetical protein